VERSALAQLGVPVPGLSDPEIERIEDVAGLGEVAAPLADAMASLPEEQRRAVELRVIDECGYADVAVKLGISEQTARARVSRGLRALAQRLSEPAAVLKSVVQVE
jgi:RNA polymerase sigma-70 factor (ECF subfamily)